MITLPVHSQRATEARSRAPVSIGWFACGGAHPAVRTVAAAGYGKCSALERGNGIPEDIFNLRRAAEIERAMLHLRSVPGAQQTGARHHQGLFATRPSSAVLRPAYCRIIGCHVLGEMAPQAKREKRFP